jgi:hypothetical protein
MSESADIGQNYGLAPGTFERAGKPISGPDVAAGALGVISFIAAFFPYVGFSGKTGGRTVSLSINAWHSYAVVGISLLVGAAVALVLGIAAASASPQAKPVLDLVAASMAAVGTLLVVVRALSYRHVSIDWGGWIVIVAGAAETLSALASLLVLAARMRREADAGDGDAPSLAASPTPN